MERMYVSTASCLIISHRRLRAVLKEASNRFTTRGAQIVIVLDFLCMVCFLNLRSYPLPMCGTLGRLGRGSGSNLERTVSHYDVGVVEPASFKGVIKSNKLGWLCLNL